MKIISLISENFKKLKAIEIRPGDKSTVVISGKNGQGKSSILDSIFVALGGKPSDLTKPIREGEERATIKVELDDYFVTRTFKQGSSKLEVIGKETGEIMSSPQTLLDKIIGKLAFDPLEFQNMKEKDQRATLLKLTKLDLDAYAVKRQDLYDRRREEGTIRDGFADLTVIEVDQAEKVIAGGKVDVAQTLAALNEAQEKQRTYDNAVAKRKEQERELQELKDQILVLELKKKTLEEAISSVVIAPMEGPNPVIAGLQNRLSTAQAQNDAYAKAEGLLTQYKARKVSQEAWDKLDAEIAALDKERNQKLQSAVMPIEGLSVTDDNVTYKNIPFAQLSSAEKLKISMAIAMAMNPELRVIRISDGSLLDDDNMAVIAEMAGEKDFQVWIEKVDSSGKVGFYIEEGEVKSVNE